jgi:hypothetical protein
MAEMNNGTGAGLVAFLDRAGSRGDLNQSTAHGLKAAVSQVLGIEDGLDQVDIKDLDVDNLLIRFATLRKSEYTPASMRSYQSRFRNAVTMYRAWLNNDPNWRRTVKARPAAEKNSGPQKVVKPSLTSATEPVQDRAAERVRHESDSDFIAAGDESKALTVNHQFPLRPGLIVQLRLPVDLTVADAIRVSNFVRSLAFDDAPAAAPHDHAGTANE